MNHPLFRNLARLTGTGSRENLFLGYTSGAVLMVVAAVVELRIGVGAERMPLERGALPLWAEE